MAASTQKAPAARRFRALHGFNSSDLVGTEEGVELLHATRAKLRQGIIEGCWHAASKLEPKSCDLDVSLPTWLFKFLENHNRFSEQGTGRLMNVALKQAIHSCPGHPGQLASQRAKVWQGSPPWHEGAPTPTNVGPIASASTSTSTPRSYTSTASNTQLYSRYPALQHCIS